MSQIPLTNAERIDALRRFGYSQQEAGFLCVAALHGGYFLRRQYAHYVRRQDGGTVTQLIEKALAQEHIKASTWRNKIQIYHLCARPFYDALGQTDNRNRRRRQPLTIKSKLMGLDFVLDHRDVHYLATEQEKLAFFVDTLHIPVAELPTQLYRAQKSQATTARYFIDKFPIFLPEAAASSHPPVVSFCFVDEGQGTLSRFETYLAQYRPLFRSLAEFCLIYLAATEAPFKGAERLFERNLTGWDTGKASGAVDPEIQRLLEHFSTRRQYETKQFTSFDRAKLIRFRQEREEFSGLENDALYERWKAGGAPSVIKILKPETKATARTCGAFSTCLLKYDYELFGNFTAA